MAKLSRLDVVQPHVAKISIAVRQLYPAQRLVDHAPPLPRSTTSQTGVAHRAAPSTSPQVKPAAASDPATIRGVSVIHRSGTVSAAWFSLFGVLTTIAVLSGLAWS
jgi:hypothetical protein